VFEHGLDNTLGNDLCKGILILLSGLSPFIHLSIIIFIQACFWIHLSEIVVMAVLIQGSMAENQGL